MFAKVKAFDNVAGSNKRAAGVRSGTNSVTKSIDLYKLSVS